MGKSASKIHPDKEVIFEIDNNNDVVNKLIGCNLYGYYFFIFGLKTSGFSWVLFNIIIKYTSLSSEKLIEKVMKNIWLSLKEYILLNYKCVSDNILNHIYYKSYFISDIGKDIYHLSFHLDDLYNTQDVLNRILKYNIQINKCNINEYAKFTDENLFIKFFKSNHHLIYNIDHHSIQKCYLGNFKNKYNLQISNYWDDKKIQEKVILITFFSIIDKSNNKKLNKFICQYLICPPKNNKSNNNFLINLDSLANYINQEKYTFYNFTDDIKLIYYTIQEIYCEKFDEFLCQFPLKLNFTTVLEKTDFKNNRIDYSIIKTQTITEYKVFNYDDFSYDIINYNDQYLTNQCIILINSNFKHSVYLFSVFLTTKNKTISTDEGKIIYLLGNLCLLVDVNFNYLVIKDNMIYLYDLFTELKKKYENLISCETIMHFKIKEIKYFTGTEYKNLPKELNLNIKLEKSNFSSNKESYLKTFDVSSLFTNNYSFLMTFNKFVNFFEDGSIDITC